MTQLMRPRNADAAQKSNANHSPRAAVSVDELKRGWAAVQAGQFRRSGTHTPTPSAGPAAPRVTTRQEPNQPQRAWVQAPTEHVVTVLGCAGSVGASTIALAIATAGVDALATPSIRPRSRVIECASVTASGLAGVSTAELGAGPESGWVHGTRDEVLIERVADILAGVEEVPVPSDLDDSTARPVGLTVLDVAWEFGQILAGNSWLRDHVVAAESLVLVTTATVPGLRRLEGVLDLLNDVQATHTHGPVPVAVVGPRRRRWVKGLQRSADPRTRALLRSEQVIEVPNDTGLAAWGLGSAPLPAALLNAAADLLRHLPAGNTHQKHTDTEGSSS